MRPEAHAKTLVNLLGLNRVPFDLLTAILLITVMYRAHASPLNTTEIGRLLT